MSRTVIRWVSVLMAGAALLNLWQQWQNTQAWLPVAARWGEPASQAEQLARIDGVPLDLLLRANAVLPRETSVLLVTPGTDVRHSEYTTYHRALYWLAPRPVWWLSPAPDDGTWEARWWTPTRLDAVSISAQARAHQAAYVLVMGSAPDWQVGQPLFVSVQGALYALDRAAAGAAPLNGAGYAGVLWPLQLLVALATLWLPGALLLRIVRPLYAGWLEALAWAWLAGVGVTTLVMLALAAAGLGLAQQIPILSVLMLVGVAIWVKRGSLRAALTLPRTASVNAPRSAVTHPDERANSRIAQTAALGLRALLLMGGGLVAINAVVLPLHGWDAWVTWGMKARAIFLTNGLSTAVYADPSRAVTHLDYPLLLPLAEAWLYGWLGAPDDRLAGAIVLVFYAALLALCYGTLRRRGTPILPARLAALLVATLLPVTQAAGGAFADVPLAAVALAAAVALVDWLEHGRASSLWLAALAAGLLPWIKREGWLLVLALCIAAWIAAPDRRKAVRASGMLALAALAVSGPWYAFMAAQGIGNSDFLPLTLPTLAANLNRVPSIGWHVLLNLANPGWNLIWFAGAALAAWLFIYRRERRRASDCLPVAALVYLVLVGLSFIFSAHVPYQQHIVSAIDRLTAHVAPLAVVWLASRSTTQA